MNIGSNIFECEFTRLSDLMIPMAVFNNQVQRVEGIDTYNVAIRKRIDGEVRDITSDMRVLPYPFVDPVRPSWAKHCKTHSINTLSERDHAQWKAEIDYRTNPYCVNAIDSTLVEQIDATPHLGTIVHLMSGYLVTVDYRYLDDITIITFPEEFPKIGNLLKHYRQKSVNGNVRDQLELLEGIKRVASDDHYIKFYYPVYHTADDEITPITKLITGTYQRTNLLPLAHTIQLSEEILEKLRMRKRIIVTV